MRAIVILLAFLLAGCSAGNNKDEPLGRQGPPTSELEAAPEAFDHISERLSPNSTNWQDFLIIEDRLVAGNASMEFTTGRGMGCQGDVDNVSVGQTGWVACMVRLAARPEALSQAVHDLGIGYDMQRLTRRQAAEPVEWRVLVVLEDGGAAFDSGWRPVDLSPAISDPVVDVEVHDPCDRVDPPVDPPQLGPEAPAVDAIIKVALDATHGRPFVRIDLGLASRPGDGESKPYAAHGTAEHGFEARWETGGAWRNYTLELIVDIEAAAQASGPTEGPCDATMGKETQEWTVDVGILGADGKMEYKTQTLLVDVYLTAA